MKSTRKLLLVSVALFAGLAIAAKAADLTPFTGPQDPSQLNASLNTLERNIQTGVNGLIATMGSTVSSTATTIEQTLYSTAIATSTLSKAGQALRVRCSGTTANNTHPRTIKVYYGTSVFTSPNLNMASPNWEMELVVSYQASATSAKYWGRGSFGQMTQTGSAMGTIATANTSDNMASALNAKCTSTTGTGGQASALDVELMTFAVEQVK